MGLFGKVKDAQRQARDAMANAGGMAGIADSMKGMASPGTMDEQLRYREKAQRLKASGIEAPAVINTITPGAKETLSGSIATVFEVMIKPSDGEAFPATIKQSMLQSALDSMSVGEAITVRFDPEDRSSALIYSW